MQANGTLPPKLHEVSTRENDGRNTIDRYQQQFFAAAYASLEILDGKEIDRVFCDFHDDYVVRRIKNNQHTYHFFQVKTREKRNYLWSLSDSFGLNRKKYKTPSSDDLEKIKASFFGKLLLHTINFGSACNESALLTNVNFHDDVEALIKAIRGNENNTDAKFLIEKFQEIFGLASTITEDTTKAYLNKLNIYPNTTHIVPGNNDFVGVAREAIYKYSEIDLSHQEITEIAQNLVALAFKKSFKKLMHDVSESELDEKAGIGIDDLLAVLSISKAAYISLLKSGDEKALKSASIIQRRLRKAGAGEGMIEYCTRQKIAWDIWIRDKRHSADEFEFNKLQHEVAQLATKWNGANWDWLSNELIALATKLANTRLGANISRDLLVGGVFASLIRGESL